MFLSVPLNAERLFELHFCMTLDLTLTSSVLINMCICIPSVRAEIAAVLRKLELTFPKLITDVHPCLIASANMNSKWRTWVGRETILGCDNL